MRGLDLVSRSEAAAHGGVPQDLVELGRVTSAYGLRGWVKIQPHAAGSPALLGVREWWLQRPAAALNKGDPQPPWPVRVSKSRRHGATVVASLEGVTDRNQAEPLRGCTVWVSRAAFPATENDEYYWVDLIGCTVYGTEAGERVLLGVVDHVMDNGVHAILRVQRQRVDSGGVPQPMLDSRGMQVETLIPFVAAHVHTVDLTNRRLETDWPADF